MNFLFKRKEIITIILTILITASQAGIHYYEEKINNNYKKFLQDAISLVNDNINIASYTSNVGLQAQRLSDAQCSECLCGSQTCNAELQKYCIGIAEKMALVEVTLNQGLVKQAEEKVESVASSTESLEESQTKYNPIIKWLNIVFIILVLFVVLINAGFLIKKDRKIKNSKSKNKGK